ncbi:uncharacterized protein BCR38DRAFT_508085 [Pseudomassariella vexata]|uniref:Uncharacterized protein n=1 Tax=Pseudomassariella vexata TaxID=1141098 RepID=A0A1Y2EBC0_9PEZI|nr:uncharacterized protein BCR38DRAFT_508085 [Pseudomassariella vexata]ORY68873.1 hypothetical protein BCR38DRAFT_508085 [Pseudomassariella vexata]
MALLLEKRGNEIQITQDIIEAAAGNVHSGHEIINWFLTERKNDTKACITGRVCIAAAACGQQHALGLLYEHVAPGNVCPVWKVIALFYTAAHLGDANQIRQLLRDRTPPDTKNIRGETPLWVAAQYRRTDVVRVFLQEKNIDVNSLSTSGQSAVF